MSKFTPELTTHQAIVKAIVHLNFNEADKALDILLGALSDYNYNFEHEKGELRS